MDASNPIQQYLGVSTGGDVVGIKLNASETQAEGVKLTDGRVQAAATQPFETLSQDLKPLLQQDIQTLRHQSAVLATLAQNLRMKNPGAQNDQDRAINHIANKLFNIATQNIIQSLGSGATRDTVHAAQKALAEALEKQVGQNIRQMAELDKQANPRAAPTPIASSSASAEAASPQTATEDKKSRRLSRRFSQKISSDIKKQSAEETAASSSSSAAAAAASPAGAGSPAPRSQFMKNWVAQHQDPAERRPDTYATPARFHISKHGKVDNYEAAKIPGRDDKKGLTKFKEETEFTLQVLNASAEFKKTGAWPPEKKGLFASKDPVITAAQEFVKSNPEASERDLRNLAAIYANDHSTYISDEAKAQSMNHAGMVTQVAVSIDPSIPRKGNTGEEVFRFMNTIISVSAGGREIKPLLADYNAFRAADADTQAAHAMQNFQQLILVLGNKFNVPPDQISRSFAERGNTMNDAREIYKALNENPQTKPIADALNGLTQTGFNAASNVIGTAMTANGCTLGSASGAFPRSDHTYLKSMQLRETPTGFTVEIRASLSDVRNLSKKEDSPENIQTEVRNSSTYQLECGITFNIDGRGQFSEPTVQIRDVDHSKLQGEQKAKFEQTLRQLQ